jgi:hypothetical protein
MTRAEGLSMASVDVVEQPWIICVDFFQANASFGTKIDKAIAILSFGSRSIFFL